MLTLHDKTQRLIQGILMMQFTELQRRLADAGCNKQMRYILSTLFEQQLELQKQFDAFTDLLVKMSDTMQGLSTQQQLSIDASMRSIRAQRDDGLVKSSVLDDPDDDDRLN
jgi:hypothetical protein